MNNDYSQNNPLGGSAEVCDIESEKELVERSEQEDNKLKNMKITKSEVAMCLFLVLTFVWIVGKTIDAVLAGNFQI